MSNDKRNLLWLSFYNDKLWESGTMIDMDSMELNVRWWTDR